MIALGLSSVQLSTAQQGSIAEQNAVKTGARERLAEIEKQTQAIAGNITLSEHNLKVARSAIAAKRKIAADLDREAGRVTAEMTAGMRQTRRLDDDLARLKRDYGKAVYLAWKNHKTNNSAAFLLASRDFNDATRRIALVRRYNAARVRQGARIDSLNRMLQAEIERLGAKKNEIAGLRDEGNRVLASLAGDEAKYTATIRTLAGDRRKLDAEARREREKIAAAQREIDRIIAEQARAAGRASLSEADMALSGQFGENKGRLPWPTGAPGLILHGFGKERSSDGIESDFKGLIIAARPGSDVRTVFEGTVTWISDLGNFDKCVMVRSGEYVVGYGNIAAPSVRNGEKVAVGQSLGTINNSDNPDRHLVMVWMQHGNTVLDPEQWLRR